MKIILVNQSALLPVYFGDEARDEFLDQLMHISLLLTCSNIIHVPLFFSFGSYDRMSSSQNMLDLFFRLAMMRHPGCDHGRGLTQSSPQHTHVDEDDDRYKIVFKKIHILIDSRDPTNLHLQTIRDCVIGQCLIDELRYQDAVIILLDEDLFLAANSGLCKIPRNLKSLPSLPFIHSTLSSVKRDRYSYPLVAIHDVRTRADYRPLLCDSRHTYTVRSIRRIGRLCTGC